jgi:hypothetical protein
MFPQTARRRQQIPLRRRLTFRHRARRLAKVCLPDLEKDEHRVAAILFREWQSPDFELKLRREILNSLLKTINRLRQQSDPHSPPLLFDSFLETLRSGLKLATVEQLYALRLDEFIKRCCQAFYGRLFFIFDQFEEYIYYHPLSEDGKHFDEQLAAAINDRSVPAGFLVSLREDGLGKLDRLRGRIPDLLGNVIRLEHLDKNGAEEAIRKPLRIFNRDSPVKVEVTDDFTATLLNQADADRLEWDEPADSTEGELPRSDRGVRYRALALQAVLTRLWNGYVAPKLDRPTRNNGRIHISQAALQQVAQRIGKNGHKRDKEDEVRSIVRTYFDERLARLDKRSQKNAAEILPHMVRAGGQKKAQLVKSLARASGLSDEDVQATIDKLRAEPLNLVKEVPSKAGSLYELHHDVMAFAVREWSVRKQAEIRERRQLWIWIGSAALLFAVLYAVAWGLLNQLSSRQMEMREKIAVVEKQLGKIANHIGISADPLIVKVGLLEAIDLYAWSRKEGIPESEGTLITLYLAPEQRDKSTPLDHREAINRQLDVGRKIPALSVAGGKFTLIIEDKNTPVFLNRDEGKVERLSALASPIVEIGFSESLTHVGVHCQDGSSVVWDIHRSYFPGSPALTRSAKTTQPLETALALDDAPQESRQKLVKSSSEPESWKAGYTALGQEWLLRALSTVTRSPEEYPDYYKLRNDTGKPLTQSLHKAIQLAGADQVNEAILLLSQELGKLGFKTEREEPTRRFREILALSALYRVMEEFQNSPLRMDPVAADSEPRYERSAIALNPKFKSKIDAQKEIRRGNMLSSQGDENGAREAYREAIELDSELAKSLNPDEQSKSFSGTMGRDQKIASGNEAAQRGELDKAVALYREAIALDPQLARSLDPEVEARKWQERQSGPPNP